MTIKLIRPTRELKDNALDFRQEFFDNEEPVIHGSEMFDNINDYDA